MHYEKYRYLLKGDTRNIVQRTTTSQSPSKQALWDLTQFSQSPSTALLYLPESCQLSEIFSLSKVMLVFGKTRSRGTPNLGYRGLSHLGDLMFHTHKKNFAQEVMHGRCIVAVKL